MFLFGDIVRTVGLILNNNNPLECFVLFPPAAPMQDVIGLPENPHGWGPPCTLWAGSVCSLPSVVKLSYSLCVYIGIVICHKAMYIL